MGSVFQGLFWDEAAPRPERGPCQPPPVTWTGPDYLPGYDEAAAYVPNLFTDAELATAQVNREPLIYDIEIFQNYFLLSFMSFVTGKIIYFEKEEGKEPDYKKIDWIINNFLLVGFNNLPFDSVLLALLMAKKSLKVMHVATTRLIQEDARPYEVLRSNRVQRLKLDQIDLIEVAPLHGSLKIYCGRLHGPKMQDLPFQVNTILTDKQKIIVRHYNMAGDLVATAFVFKGLGEQIALRAKLSNQYGIDVRSKSDAQIAEAVIGAELKRLTLHEATRPSLEMGSTFRYQPPSYLVFSSKVLSDIFNLICVSDFFINSAGIVEATISKELLKFNFGKLTYQVGIGGLHSCEEKTAHVATADTLIIDRDVTSYYPYIILNNKLFPKHLGREFLEVFKTIVERRLAAKKAKNHAISETLKITINGSFGKFGNKWSILYAPDLLIQVTVTGQLSLLMLIERLEAAGIEICSANTDGVVMKCGKAQKEIMEAVVSKWEKDTSFETEATNYRALYSRDVNNYIAIKEDGTAKTKGAYNNPWADPKQAIFRFHKNPVTTICIEAAIGFLAWGKPIKQTIRECQDVKKFVAVRHVNGGAVKDGNYIGRAIRWYYAINEKGEIIYAKTGNKVPSSEGARLLMSLPKLLPNDIDYPRYELEANEILEEIGCKFCK